MALHILWILKRRWLMYCCKILGLKQSFAQQKFQELFQKKDFTNAEAIDINTLQNPISIIELLKKLDAAKSSSEASRLITSGAVHIDGQKITDFKAIINLKTGMRIKIGKHRFFKVV